MFSVGTTRLYLRTVLNPKLRRSLFDGRQIYPSQSVRPPQNRVLGIVMRLSVDRRLTTIRRITVDAPEGARVVRPDVHGLRATAARSARNGLEAGIDCGPKPSNDVRVNAVRLLNSKVGGRLVTTHVHRHAPGSGDLDKPGE